MSVAFVSSPAVSVSSEQRAEYATAAADLALVAGQATLPFFRAGAAVQNKRTDGGFDPVTEADRAAESVIRNELAQRFPDHGIYGEEFGHQPGNGLTWIIDPIDGTRAFMSGQLHWGVLVGLYDGQNVIAGAFCQPFVGELLWGDGSQSFYQRGTEAPQRLSVSGRTALSDSILATTGVDYFEQPAQRDHFATLSDQVQLTRHGGDCYIYVLVALGEIELAIDGGLNPYDIAALIPIVQGAGGVVARLDGDNPAMGGWVLAAANEQLLQDARKILDPTQE
jgi:myo-inositol-1(or 4)-monophosphatase